MCPLRYILIFLSVCVAIWALVGGSYTPEFLQESELKRQQQNKKWYETLWQFASGKHLYQIWKDAKSHEQRLHSQSIIHQ